MKKYFLHLAYKGSKYRGWQRQTTALGVQQVLEEAVEKMLGKKINCVGCGRTDAGVHASQYYCHIVVDADFGFDPVKRLNNILPDDINVYECIEVPIEVHAQKDAKARTYTYKIHFQKNPFLNELSTYYEKEGLDINKVKRAIDLVPKYDDFKAFCKTPSSHPSTICYFSKADMHLSEDKKQLILQFTANRFLKGMVRLLVGNIMEVGYGRLALEEFEDCLRNGESPKYFNMAYPQGLYLSEVVYDFL